VSYGGSLSDTTFNFSTRNEDSAGATLTDLTQLDAAFSIDGFDIVSASNNVTSVVDGLNIELKGEGSATLNVTRDTESIEESAQSFVDAYNDVFSTIDTLQAGQLSGDSTLLSVERQMRGILNTAPSGLTGAFSALSQVGIKTDRDTGQLTLNTSEFTEALDADFAGLAQLFANDDQGYAYRFDSLAGSLLDQDGVIDSREDGLNARVRRLEDDQADLERRLDLREVALRREYSALDQLVGSLQSTSTFLLQNFSAL
jgi:flagellar hook-associated protein 2